MIAVIAERIKELGGEPTSEPAAKTEKGQAVSSIFLFDASLEDDTIDAYNQNWVKHILQK